jgi:predicted Zn-dependent peptidase
MGLQSNADRADAVGMFEVNTDDYKNVMSYPDMIQAVTAEDVMTVAAKYLTELRRTVVNIIPDNGETGNN